MTRAIVILALLAAPASADRWTAGDSFSQVGVGLVFAADMLQTRNICAAADTSPHHESNPIMGDNCDQMRPEIYFPIAFAAHALIARALPQPWRRTFQAMTVAVQIGSIEKNLSAGYSITW